MGPRACPRAGLGLLPVVILAALLAAGAAACCAPRECSAGNGYESDKAGARQNAQGRWYKPQDMPRCTPGPRLQKMSRPDGHALLVPSRKDPYCFDIAAVIIGCSNRPALTRLSDSPGTARNTRGVRPVLPHLSHTWVNKCGPPQANSQPILSRKVCALYSRHILAEPGSTSVRNA